MSLNIVSQKQDSGLLPDQPPNTLEDDFDPRLDMGWVSPRRIYKLKEWVFNHPSTTQALKMSSFIFGAGLLALCPPSAATIGGGSVLAAASTALHAFYRQIPQHHDMRNHVFQPGKCTGGELYYDGDVPILSLDSDDSYWAGRAQGYLCGEAIDRICKKHQILRGQDFPNVVAALKRVIPSQYLREMNGLVKGYLQWSKEHWWLLPKKLTEDDLLLIQVIPDSYTSCLALVDCWIEADGLLSSKPKSSIACTSLVDRVEGNLILARTLDWPSETLNGTYSLVINRKHFKGLHSTVEVAIPLFIGMTTGMNDQRVAMAMNSLGGGNITRGPLDSLIKGMPAILYNRACLERCKNVKEVEQFIQQKSPLASYHLTAVDRHNGQSIHFYQSPKGGHVIRKYQEGQPLITLNSKHRSPSDLAESRDGRSRILSHYFKENEEGSLEEALALPYVNNLDTTHCVVMEPQTGVMKVSFDNAFAAKSRKSTISSDKIFSRKITPATEF